MRAGQNEARTLYKSIFAYNPRTRIQRSLARQPGVGRNGLAGAAERVDVDAAAAGGDS